MVDTVRLGGFGGSTTVSRAGLARAQAELERKRRIQTQGLRNRFESAGPGIPEAQGFFGLSQSPTGNRQSVRTDGGAVTSAGDIAAQFGSTPGQQLTAEQQAAVGQFFSPSLTEDQSQQLARFATISAGQGILGGAVRSQLSNQGARFVAGNRLDAFDTVTPLISQGFQNLTQQVSPFLSQFGQLSALAGGPFGNQSNLFLGVDGQSAGDLRQFATPALRALQAFGLGADAISGLAQAANVNVGQGGTTGRSDIAGAFSQFALPTAAGIEGFVRDQAGGLASRRRAGFAARQRSFRAANRLGAAEFLRNTVQSQFQNVARGVGDFTAANIGSQSLAGIGGLEQARQLAGRDFSNLAPLFGQLGVTPTAASGQGVSITGNEAFVPNSSLFRAVAGL